MKEYTKCFWCSDHSTTIAVTVTCQRVHLKSGKDICILPLKMASRYRHLSTTEGGSVAV